MLGSSAGDLGSENLLGGRWGVVFYEFRDIEEGGGVR